MDDMAVLRHGGMGRSFARSYAPSTLASFLRGLTFGHIRHLDAVASRFLRARRTSLVGTEISMRADDQQGGYTWVDVDDTAVEVPGRAKQDTGLGYNRIRCLNALLATLTTTFSPVILAQRLRRGQCNSSLARSGWSATRPRLPASSLAPGRGFCANGRGVLRPRTGPRRVERRRRVSVTVWMNAQINRDRRHHRRRVDHHRVHRRDR
ncbi:hypothetical protein [Nocardioides immobilis]|uniref:hypothetical protein n=1 Tax=Nocardioides immobilis TaxID=2049295 RepID=UPI0011C40C41|nr:hypothetical protein [Nocardioides immobilis]